MNKISICYIAQGDYHSIVHSFESIGFAIKKKEVDWVDKDAPIEYIKTIGDIEVELFVANLASDSRVDSLYFYLSFILRINSFLKINILLTLC